jgi:accessory gene regulator protein AgrB
MKKLKGFITLHISSINISKAQALKQRLEEHRKKLKDSERTPEIIIIIIIIIIMKSLLRSWMVLGIVGAYFLDVAAPLSFALPTQMSHSARPCYGSAPKYLPQAPIVEHPQLVN